MLKKAALWLLFKQNLIRSSIYLQASTRRIALAQHAGGIFVLP